MKRNLSLQANIRSTIYGTGSFNTVFTDGYYYHYQTDKPSLQFHIRLIFY